MKSGYPVRMGLPNTCMLPELFAVLAGTSTVPHPTLLQPPPLVQPLPPPTPEARGHLTQTLSEHLDSEHFCVTWETEDTTEDVAARTLEALELAWDAMVERDGWDAPLSSENWLLSTMLDPSLDGTGFTGQYTDNATAVVYPYIWINPLYEDMPEFFRSLAAHEFNHALQWRKRPYANGWEEPWYWEASAEWGAELALPEANAYALQSYYYAEHPEYRYSSMQDYHQYGMFLVNAFLEEYRTGSGGMHQVWLLGEQHPEKTWDKLITEISGDTLDTFWPELTTSIAHNTLEESELYEQPVRAGILGDGEGGTLDFLGTHYWKVQTDTWIESFGRVVLGSPMGTGTQVQVSEGDWLTVTGLSNQPTDYTLWFTEPPDSGDFDTGGESPALGCGCSSVSPYQGFGWGGLLLATLLQRRKRSKPTADGTDFSPTGLSC
ncbi:MAG: hypothetical protein VX519_11540 [Myxococcota bacterium]|nr:hypothetical protein [Myxococcota bacterium]